MNLPRRPFVFRKTDTADIIMLAARRSLAIRGRLGKGPLEQARHSLPPVMISDGSHGAERVSGYRLDVSQTTFITAMAELLTSFSESRGG